jgi:EmrB/QacA subfamily drug resistance transporter
MVSPDYSRKWFVMAAVGMGIFLSTIDGSIVNVALPTLVRELNTNFPTVQWVVLAYLLTLTTLMLSVGRLADMIGKKPIYTTGFAVFTIGSVLCGLAPTVGWLIGFRVLQAFGAAMILALGMAIITEAFPRSERGRALGISGAIVSIGIVVGPTLGGLLLQNFSWHWIFFVNLPVGIIGIWMVLRYVPAIQPEGGQRFDFAGAAVLFIGLLSLLLALTRGQTVGFTQPAILALLAVFILALLLFLWIETHQAQPMVDLKMFRNSAFSISLLTGFGTFVAIAGTLLLMPFYLENVLGYNPQQVGLLLAVLPVTLGLVAPLSGSLSDRFGSKIITLVGLFILGIGYSLLSRLAVDTTAVVFLLLFLPIGAGMGAFQSPNNSLIMGSAPPGRLGIVSGMLAITRTLGQTTGIALLGAAWSARVFFYSGEVLAAGATTAPPAAQVKGLQDVFISMAILMAAAFVLSFIEWRVQRRQPSSIPVGSAGPR